MKLKKFFAAVCAATVALSSFSLSAFAAGELEIAKTNNVAAKSVTVTYSLSTEQEHDWEYNYNNVALIVKTWNNAAGAGDWIQWGLGGKEQAQYFSEGQFVSYDGTAIVDADLTINLTEYDTLNELAVLYTPDDNWDFSVSAIKAYSGADGSGDVTWEYTAAAKPDDGEKDPDDGDKDAPNKPGEGDKEPGGTTVATKIADLEFDEAAIGDTFNAWGGAWAKSYHDILKSDDLTKYQVTIKAEVADADAAYDKDNNIALKVYGGSIKKGEPDDKGVYTVTVPGVAGEKSASVTLNVGDDLVLDEWYGFGFNVMAGHLAVKITYAAIEEVPASIEEPGETEEPTVTTTVLWEGEQEMPADWTGSVEIPSSEFADAAAGDKVVLYITPGSGTQVSIKQKNEKWEALPGFAAANDGHDYSDVITADTYTLTLTADDIAALAEYNMIVTGHDYTLTKVELVSASGGSDDPGTTPGGSDTPGTDTPGTDDPGTTPGGVITPGEPIGEVTLPNSSSTTTPDDDKNAVKFENNDTKIEVTAPEGAFDKPADVTFNAAPVADETSGETFTFDLSFTDKDGNKVQPKSAVTVSVPLPTALTGKTVFVYHIEDNGTYTEINCKVENGMVVFSASSFSKYVITTQKLNASGAPADSTTTNPGGSTTNPGTGVALSLLPIALASAAVVISKKRK